MKYKWVLFEINTAQKKVQQKEKSNYMPQGKCKLWSCNWKIVAWAGIITLLMVLKWKPRSVHYTVYTVLAAHGLRDMKYHRSETQCKLIFLIMCCIYCMSMQSRNKSEADDAVRLSETEGLIEWKQIATIILSVLYHVTHQIWRAPLTQTERLTHCSSTSNVVGKAKSISKWARKVDV